MTKHKTRSGTNTGTSKMPRKRQRPNAWAKSRLAILVAGIVLLTIGGVMARPWFKVRQAGVPPGNSVATESLETPSEQSVSADYTVPADRPLAVTIPSINVQGFIQQVGVDKANQMVAPSNVHMAGWYARSVLPGDAGLSIIDGHVNGLYAKGVFARLHELLPGQELTITFGDKRTKSFTVKDIKTVSAAEATKELYIKDPGITSQLNLITCAGRYDKNTKTYDQRVIVVAAAQD